MNLLHDHAMHFKFFWVEPFIKNPINNSDHLTNKLWEKMFAWTGKGQIWCAIGSKPYVEGKFNHGKNPDESGLIAFLKETIEPKGAKPYFTPMPTPTKSEPGIETKAESETSEMFDTNANGI